MLQLDDEHDGFEYDHRRLTAEGEEWVEEDSEGWAAPEAEFSAEAEHHSEERELEEEDGDDEEGHQEEEDGDGEEGQEEERLLQDGEDDGGGDNEVCGCLCVVGCVWCSGRGA
jgi:hypothetical protein